jgi:hypothetical protein
MEVQDTVKIQSALMKSFLGKILANLIKKKLGRKVKIEIRELDAANDGGEIDVYMTVRARMSTVEFAALLEQLDL